MANVEEKEKQEIKNSHASNYSMKSFKNSFTLLFFLTQFLLSQATHAFDGDGLTLKSIAMNFDFSEFNETGSAVTEKGLIFGGELELGKGWGPLWMSINGQFLKGEVDYDGFSQDKDGNIKSGHKTVTAETIFDTSVQVGRIYESWRRHDYALIYAGAGFHQWARDIKSKGNVVGLFERYTWFYAHLGARGFLFRTSRSYLMVELNILRTFKPTMDVSFKVKDIDNARVSLGEHFGAKLSIPYRYEVKRWLHLYSEFFYEAWDLGESNSQILRSGGFLDETETAGGRTFKEPRSTSRFYGLKLGVFLKFD